MFREQPKGWNCSWKSVFNSENKRMEELGIIIWKMLPSKDHEASKDQIAMRIGHKMGSIYSKKEAKIRQKQ